jgi:hypothetical protein
MARAHEWTTERYRQLAKRCGHESQIWVRWIERSTNPDPSCDDAAFLAYETATRAFHYARLALDGK